MPSIFPARRSPLIAVAKHRISDTSVFTDLRKKSLHDFCALGEAPLEDIEKLEQLRALYHGKKISMVNVASSGFGIDTVEDLERAKKIFGV